MKSLISVIIPTLNRGHLISRAIKSVYENTYKNVEVIVVDQDSSDNTSDVVRDLGLELLTEPILGAGRARKKGLSHARGERIVFLDSDDWLSPFALGLLLKTSIDADAELTYGLIQPVSLDAEISHEGPPDCAPLTSCSMTHRDSFQRFGGLDDDNYSWPRWISSAREHGLRVQHVDEVVAYRGIHSENLSKGRGATSELFALARAHRDSRNQG